MSKKSEFEYLDDERKKLWADVTAQRDELDRLNLKFGEAVKKFEILEQEVEKKTSDYEKEAKAASAQTTRYKNKAADSAKAAETSETAISSLAERALAIEEHLIRIQDFFNSALIQQQQFEVAATRLEAAQAEVNSRVEEVNATLEEAEITTEAANTIAAKIEELKVSTESTASKISTAHTQAVKRSKEITDLHDTVFGYATDDETTGETVEVIGLKSELEGTYETLKKNLGEFGKELTGFKNQKVEQFNDFSKEKSKEFDSLKDQIKSLMPDAMTAGLSHAYETKRKSEEEEGKKAGITYWRSIALLLSISLIPVIVSLYSFFHDGKQLDQIIQSLPQIVMATLPLYAPAFWFAISASKRIKLARRLTEEYAHKEVLSKTFEGLSTQISSLPDSEISRELRVRLLYNIINVSSENPGRLISDYNSSDNPLMEVLDKSLSLTKSLEKIAAIPGVQRIMKKVEQKREENLAKMEESIEENIEDDSPPTPKQTAA